MQAAELFHLESQVDHLMHVIKSLQTENNQLRQKIATHIQDYARLQHKTERTTQQVKQIIKNMKEELS